MNRKPHKLKSNVKKVTFGFRWRLNAVFGVLLVLVLLVTGLVNMWTQKEMLEDRLDTRVSEISSMMAEVSASYLFDRRLDELEIIYEDVFAQDDVVDIIAIDLDGLRIADGKMQDDSFLLDRVDDPIFEQALATEQLVRVRRGNTEKLGIPVFFNLKLQGVVRIDISTEGYQQELETVIKRNLYIGLAFVVIALLICNILAQHMARPLNQLIEFTKRVSSGHLEDRVSVRSNDEVELLGDAFNMMVSELSSTMAEVQQLAYRDALTGLRNRTWITNYVTRFIETANASQKARAALFLLDMDRFKFINDTFGHHAGDEVLQEVARRITDIVDRHPLLGLERDDDFNNRAFATAIARLGGDEFVLFLPELASQDEISMLAETIVDAFRKPLSLSHGDQSITISLGIAGLDHATSSFEALFKMADSAMYQAKSKGKNNVQLFDRALAAEQEEKRKLETELRVAISEKQFEAYFQPQVNIETGSIQGAEALLRWRHPEHGILAPGVFLPIAIEAGMMVEIGRCMFETAIKQASEWRLATEQQLHLSLNATAVELEQADFSDFLTVLLAKYDFDPTNLELEITEDTLMENEEMVEKQIKTLKSYGIRIAVDDFGVGYSNLARLRKLRFDTLKIDKSLMVGLGADQEAESLIRSILSLAHALKLNVVAEGVEQSQQLDFLFKEACQTIQGFLFFRPLDQETMTTLIATSGNTELPGSKAPHASKHGRCVA